MFLTKKGQMKAIAVGAVYFILGFICSIFSIKLGVITIIAGVAFALYIRRVEGYGRWLNLGIKLVRKQLRPHEFINTYESLKNANNLVVNKPEFDVLQLAAVAYNCVGEREKCLSTVDEMIAVAPLKKKAIANLVKVSYLFDYGEIDKAEQLLINTQKLKFNAFADLLHNSILKDDRAMAMGDYKVAEACFIKRLEQTFPKPDNLSKLICHYNLGEIYEKTNEPEKALLHYKYCADNGGQTVIRKAAQEKIRLQN